MSVSVVRKQMNMASLPRGAIDFNGDIGGPSTASHKRQHCVPVA